MLPSRSIPSTFVTNNIKRHLSCRKSKPKVPRGHKKSRPHHFQSGITLSAPPCPSSSVACRPSLVHHFHHASLPLLSLRRQRTDPSLASSIRAAFQTASCFQHSDLDAWARAVVSLVAFACRCAGCGGRAGKQARQGPRTRRPRWQIQRECRGFAWSVRECQSVPRVIEPTRVS